MNSLHTKLKELRELREKALEGTWIYHPGNDEDDWTIRNEEYTYAKQDDSGVPISPNDANFIICAANNWLTLISALEKAIEALGKGRYIIIEDSCEECGTFKSIKYNIPRIDQALAEIAEMLEGD